MLETAPRSCRCRRRLCGTKKTTMGSTKRRSIIRDSIRSLRCLRRLQHRRRRRRGQTVVCCLVRFVLLMLEAWIAGLYFSRFCFHYTFCYGLSMLFVCANTQKHCVLFVLLHSFTTVRVQSVVRFFICGSSVCFQSMYICNNTIPSWSLSFREAFGPWTVSDR